MSAPFPSPRRVEEGHDLFRSSVLLCSLYNSDRVRIPCVCVSVLHRVRSWLDTRPGEHSGLAQSIRDSLNDYEARLSDLRAALQEAAAQARKATGLNQDSERALESIQVSPVAAADGHWGQEEGDGSAVDSVA